jgi:cobyrinic acid a,c-diamide synthase
VKVCGLVANRVGSAAHGKMVAQGLPPELPLMAALARNEHLSLPERHLGLVQALELPELDTQLDAWAEHLAQALEPEFEFPRVSFENAASPYAEAQPQALAGRRIAVAQDAAFSFIYPANLDCLRALGAELQFFSPLQGQGLPACDALWLPGGYPELHAPTLRQHSSFFDDLRQHLQAGKPLLAECGGMLCLLDQLIDAKGQAHVMAGAMPGTARMQNKLAALGLQTIAWPEGLLRGHSFHYSTLGTPLHAIATAENPNAGRTAEALYQQGSLRASYIHHYFASNPAAVAAFFAQPATVPA